MKEQPSPRIRVAALVFLLACSPSASAAKIIYVDNGAGPGGNGLNWATAFEYLQDGLTVASYGDEIRVAQGRYLPDRYWSNPSGTGEREATFRLVNGVSVCGGYGGVGELEPDQRDIEEYKTILSGDLNGDDAEGFINYDENSYHVVVADEADPNTVLDGITISGGNANGLDSNGDGGGMYNKYGSPTLIGCTLSYNLAGRGGGMRNQYSIDKTTLINCRFIRNHSLLTYGNEGGGGMHGGSPTLINCTFTGNSSVKDGGGIQIYEGSPTLSKCIFGDNSAAYNGGGISAGAGYPCPRINNCMFIGNSAGLNGGGFSCGHSAATLTNCTFIENSAGADGGGICGIAYENNLTAANCILWDNIAEEGPQIAQKSLYGVVSVNYCDIQGGRPDIYLEDGAELICGHGNIDAPPYFVDPEGGDYRLKSQAGRYDRNTGTWIADDVTSPCIDGGDPMTAIGCEPFPNGGIVNIGFYGGTAEAGKSYFGGAVCGTIMAGDLNGDCEVNYLDLALMTLHWLENNL